jgi:mono/diheme cytochrome c family protein
MRRLVILGGLVVALAGCGGGEEASPTAETVAGTSATTETGDGGAAGEGDPANGKEVFASAGCGSCHTLADAGSSGTIGPNLDDAQPSFELAVDRVTNGASPMPAFKDQLSEQEIADVAAYVVDATSG